MSIHQINNVKEREEGRKSLSVVGSSAFSISLFLRFAVLALDRARFLLFWIFHPQRREVQTFFFSFGSFPSRGEGRTVQ